MTVVCSSLHTRRLFVPVLVGNQWRCVRVVLGRSLYHCALLLLTSPPQCTYSKWSPGKAVCRPTGCLFIIVVYLQRQTVGRLYADSGPLTFPPQTTLTPHTGSKCAIIFMYHRYRHSHTHTHKQKHMHIMYRIKTCHD